MRIICLVKFTPDVDSFVFDYEKQELIREDIKQIINPDDACAVGFALNLKKQDPQIEVEVITMAPLSILNAAEDIARRGIDKVTILSDKEFAGSDTLATTRVLGSYIGRQKYDVILTGCRSIDGDTGHVPSELAGDLDLNCLSGITWIDEEGFVKGKPAVQVETEFDTQIYEVTLPAVLGISVQSGYRLPFVRYANLDLDVSDRVQVLGCEELGISKEMAGMDGSATKVVRTYPETFGEKQERIFVRDDEEGVETVFRFLKERGFLP